MKGNNMNEQKKITVKAVRRIKLKEPIPVYDATVPKYHNFALANGVIIHNTAKYARYKEYQEVLKLKGKPRNSARVTVAKMAENGAINNILVSIGYKPVIEDAKKKTNKVNDFNSRVNNIYLLADSDADGCLHADTRILLTNGNTPTIKELADQWNKDKKSFLIYSRNTRGQLILTEAIAPRPTVIVDEVMVITFNDGTVVKCTLDHKWKPDINYLDRMVEYQGQYYIQAQDLKKGDRINSYYKDVKSNLSLKERLVEFLKKTKENWSLDSIDLNFNRSVYRNRIPTNHSIERVERIKLEKPMQMYCLTVPETGNFMIADNKGNGICSGNSHINVLGLTALWKAIPQLFYEHRVRVVIAPLYTANYKGEQYFADTLEEIKKKLPEGAPSKAITRIKGWGEATVDELRQIAFDPKTRKAYIIHPPKNTEEDAKFYALVGEDTKARKEILGL